MSYYKAVCSSCGFKSKEFFIGIIGKKPEFYYPIGFDSEIISKDVYSGKVFPGIQVTLPENFIDYDKILKGNKEKHSGNLPCPKCGVETLSFGLYKKVKLD